MGGKIVLGVIGAAAAGALFGALASMTNVDAGLLRVLSGLGEGADLRTTVLRETGW